MATEPRRWLLRAPIGLGTTFAPWKLLALLCVAKIVASSLTIGTGGSAGDFAPSFVIGGLAGGAFGQACALILRDPRIDPGAFALVGMGTLYGGIAHAPISSLVMVCELAGSYDLLVPLMLAEGIAFVALRKRALYHAQVPTQRDSPAHPAHLLDVLQSIPIQQIMTHGRPFAVFSAGTPGSVMLKAIADYDWQDVFPVLDRTGKMTGIVTAETLRIMASEPELAPLTLASDAMQAPVALAEGDGLRTAIEILSANGLREVPVIDGVGKIIGFVDEADIGRAYLEATAKVGRPAEATPLSPEGSDLGKLSWRR